MKYCICLLMLSLCVVGCQTKSYSDTSTSSQQQLMINEHDAQIKEMKATIKQMQDEVNNIKQEFGKLKQDVQKVKPAYIGGNVQEGGR